MLSSKVEIFAMAYFAKILHFRPREKAVRDTRAILLFFVILTCIKSFSLISSFSNFLTSSYLVRFFRLTAPAAVQGHLGAISLKNLTKRKEVRKGVDQAIWLKA